MHFYNDRFIKELYPCNSGKVKNILNRPDEIKRVNFLFYELAWSLDIGIFLFCFVFWKLSILFLS